MAGRIHVVVGGQYGSEGKGALCARLADSVSPNSMVIRTGGPNAGHTAYDRDGTRHALRMLGTPVVRRGDIWAALGPRAVVDLDVLTDECNKLQHNVYVDPNATILEPLDILAEQDPSDLQTGSTRKGIGSARKRRLDRTGYNATQYAEKYPNHVPERAVFHESVPELARAVLRGGGDVIVEAAQGYGLGLHTDSYPHTTSADCTVMDALTDAGFNLGDIDEFYISPWVVVRPFPIRIAGESGPLKNETTWEALGLPEEYTTVTKKVRRVGDWDPDLVRAAILSAGGSSLVNVCFTMVDQVFPEIAGLRTVAELEALPEEFWSRFTPWFNKVKDSTGLDFSIDAIGTGPQTMIFVREVAAELARKMQS